MISAKFRQHAEMATLNQATKYRSGARIESSAPPDRVCVSLEPSHLSTSVGCLFRIMPRDCKLNSSTATPRATRCYETCSEAACPPSILIRAFAVLQNRAPAVPGSEFIWAPKLSELQPLPVSAPVDSLRGTVCPLKCLTPLMTLCRKRLRACLARTGCIRHTVHTGSAASAAPHKSHALWTASIHTRHTFSICQPN